LFFQQNSVKNISGSLLDLVFTNYKYLTVEESFDPIVPPDAYHSSLIVTSPNSAPESKFNHSLFFFNYRKSDYAGICSFFTSFNWLDTFKHLDPDSAMNVLYDALHLSILRYVPQGKFWDSTYPLWFSKGLKNILFLKK